MTTIRILPEVLSNQIAAGEVVQRPANAVKELLENSIDAGAKSITIEIEKGGKSLIRVSDDGIGLSRDDALLSIERYATSKLFTKEDLFSISTMGFRGEALPSIASVSKFCMVTRTNASDVATRIDISGGRIQNVSDAGAPVGTMVEVRHLLFNTPARKKFLKSENTETSHIADAVYGMALGNPDIQFRLFINGRLQKSFSLSDDLFERSVNVLGKDVADKLYGLDYSQGPVRIHGYCSNPLVTRSTSSKIFLYVNRRLVYDRGLVAAIFQGYKGRVMKGRYPLGVVFVDIDFDQVDVNVHPSKREIKFFNAQQVYQSTTLAIKDALFKAQQDVSTYSQAVVEESEDRRQPQKQLESYEFYDSAFSVQKNLTVEEQANLDFQPQAQPSVLDHEQMQRACISGPDRAGRASAEQAPVGQADPSTDQEPPAGKIEKKSPYTRVLGQVLNTYILVQTENGFMIVDQHAAHERIVYEKLKARYQSLQKQSQMLVVPQTLELNFKEANLLTRMLDNFRDLGVIIEPFGGNTFIIKSVPVIMDEKDIQPLVIEILESALVNKDQSLSRDWLEECLILMACHGAIRANLALSQIQMEELICDLEKCENPRHCPHGRPIAVFWDKGQIEKLFKRVV